MSTCIYRDGCVDHHKCKAADRCLALRKDADVDRLTLLPCPFCGEPPREHYGEHSEEHWVACESESCDVCPTTSGGSIESARRAWNRRQSLSQEAVRDEALEEAAKVCDRGVAKQEANLKREPFNQEMHGIRIGHMRDALAIRRAIKREPNAAGWNEKGIADIGVLPGEVDATAEPAPATPESLVKRLCAWVDADGADPLHLEAAAEIERLERHLSLAQTEIKGHMRNESDLLNELALARADWACAQARIAELEKAVVSLLAFPFELEKLERGSKEWVAAIAEHEDVLTAARSLIGAVGALKSRA